MAPKLSGTIALPSDRASSLPFRLDSGDHVIAAGGVGGIPSGGEGTEAITLVTLEYRFVISTDSAGTETFSAWQSTGVTLPTGGIWIDFFKAASHLEFRVVANAAGAVVHVSETPVPTY